MWIRDDDQFIDKYFKDTGDQFEIEHLERALASVSVRGLALDVGAHYGSWTRHLAKSFERVIAFEPVQETFKCLQKNVQALPNVEIRNQAVGAETSMVEVSVGKMYSHPGMETVVKFSGGATEQIRIDDLELENVDFIKIDVEGYELFVLHGARETLLRCRPTIILEENIRGSLEHNIPDGECQKYLESLGAKLITICKKDFIFSWDDPLSEQRLFAQQFEHSTIATIDAQAAGPIAAFFGRDMQRGISESNIIGGVPKERPKQKFLIVSFYTVGNGYDVYAQRLHETLVAQKMSFTISEIDALGNWESICALKSEFLLRRWRETSVPIVWLDADATVEQSPNFFGMIDADFAVHKWGGFPGDDPLGHEFGSGTLYFGKTPLAEKLLEQWTQRCRADPDTWDQVHLQSAWCDISSYLPLRTVWLPRSYLQIEGAAVLSPPVIKHWQASRNEQARGGRPKKESFLLSPKGVDARRTNRLWRTPEEAFWISEGKDHIIPATGTEFPEGFDVGEVLRRFIEPGQSVIEFGCGVGRIARFFEPAQYLGIDINPGAVAAARARNPRHQHRIWDIGYALPRTDTVLIYTVLLHVSDDAIASILKTVVDSADIVIIAEIMDSRWRREGNPPVFNRDTEEYCRLMNELGYYLASHEKHAYARYDTEPWNVGRDSRISFLKFVRRG